MPRRRWRRCWKQSRLWGDRLLDEDAIRLPRRQRGPWPPGPGARCERPPRCRDRIEGVVLAPGSSPRPVRAGHFEHRDPRQSQVAGDARTVAPGGFDPDAKQFPMRAEPAQHGPIADPCRGERFTAEHRTVEGHNGRGMQVLMGINAPDDGGAFAGRVRPVGPPGLRWAKGWAANETEVGHDSEGTPWARLSSGHEVGRGRRLDRLPLGGRHVQGMTSRSIRVRVKPPRGDRPCKPEIRQSLCGSGHPREPALTYSLSL